MRKCYNVVCIWMSILLCILTGCAANSELTADYDSPSAVATAFDNGEAVEGKTILVTATMDATGGLIYFAPDLKNTANISVLLVIDDVPEDELLTMEQLDEMISPDNPILHVKEGETVVVKIRTMYANSDYQYTIIGTFVEKE